MTPEHEPAGADERAVVATLVANHRRFLAFLEKRLGSRAVAEDVLQQAFVRGIERAGSVRADESAVAWFFRLLRNAVVDHHRRATSPVHAAGDLDPEHEPAAPDPETEAEICRCVLELARTLEPIYAAALERVELGGMAVKDYAAEAGITPNNAAVRLFRARAALARRVSATCGTCAEHGCLDCTCGTSPGGPGRGWG
jgi:RNA polymerase sigma-70 factor (ECF subfamily)